MVLVDFHGWMGMTQGNQEIGKYFNAQFNGDVYSQMVGGFFSTWAQDSLSNTRAVLVEYPKNTRSIAECINDNYSGRTYDAFINLLSSEPGNGGSSGTSGSYNGHINSGVKYVNVRQEPNTTSASTILGQLYGNNPIQILAKVKPYGDSYYWYKIVFIKDGERLQAYVREDFVTVTGEIPKDDTPAAGGEPGSLVPYDSVGQVNNNASSVHVRKGAGTGEGCEIITSVNSGELLMIIGKTQPGGQTIPWYEINLNGQELYIRSDFVDIVSETKLDEEGSINSSTGWVHLRSLPGTGDECSIITKLNNGDWVEIFGELQPKGESIPWYKIRWQAGIGFVRSDFIKLGNSELTLNELKELLNELYDEATRFNAISISSPTIRSNNILILDYLRYFGYNNHDWDIVVGLEPQFYNYVMNSNNNLANKLCKYIDNNLTQVMLGKTESSISHLAATTEAYVRSTAPHFWSGWGGDLATMIGRITSKIYTSGESVRTLTQAEKSNIETMANYKIANKDPHLSTFDAANFYEDIDAIYFANVISNKKFGELLYDYYVGNENNLKKYRQGSLMESIGCSSLNNINDAIYNTFTTNNGGINTFKGFELKDIITQGGETSKGKYPVDDFIVRTSCDAFGNKVKSLNSEGYL